MKKTEIQKLLKADLPPADAQLQLSRAYPATGDSAGGVAIATITGLGVDRYVFSLGDCRGGFVVDEDGQIFVLPEVQPLFDTFIEEIRDMTLVEVVEA